MNYSKVEGYTHLLRDEKNNSIINTNLSEYEEYISTRNAKKQENQKIQKMKEDLDNIKNDVDEIKNLLRSLINGPK